MIIGVLAQTTCSMYDMQIEELTSWSKQKKDSNQQDQAAYMKVLILPNHKCSWSTQYMQNEKDDSVLDLYNFYYHPL